MDHDRVDGGERAAANRRPSWRMHYFDSRGVCRVYETPVSDEHWQWWRDAKGFSQRFTGRFADGGHTIVGHSALRRRRPLD